MVEKTQVLTRECLQNEIIIMGTRHRLKLLKLVSIFFLIYTFIHLDLGFLLSKHIFGPPENILSNPGQESFLRKWEETNVFYKKLAKIDTEEEDMAEEDCSNPSLNYKIKSNESLKSKSCQRMKPVAGSCKIAKNLFAGRKITDCSDQKHYKLCEIKGDVGNYYARCDISTCQMPVVVGNINQVNGEYVWTELSNLQEVENHINALLRPGIKKKHYGFVFVKCILKNSKKTEVDYGNDFGLSFHDPEVDAFQLLVLPVDVKMKPHTGLKPHSESHNINYNLIFIDSVSRNHFYRSLPKTVKVMNKINKQNMDRQQSSDLNHMVLDFELLQGLKSRTFESLQALFSGYVNPKEKPFGVLAMPPKPLNTQMLLGEFKQNNYTTVWIEDLCWKWEWGLSKDLGVHSKDITNEETWKRFMRALHKAAIDNLDITFASCEILNSHNVNDPFHYADDICFLGRHHHEYIIEYLKYYQHKLQFYKNPYFSFYETNVGHEDTMLRIQQFDSSLADYIVFTSHLNNTLTILFSDHGNTYGSFVEKSDEARIEIFHPFLFMIIPPGVQSVLGQKAINSLIHNQERLISLQDLHEMLLSLSKKETGSEAILTKPHSQGLNLMVDIPINRSCSQIPRLMPNTCICQGYENKAKNDSYYGILALYATGILNRQIQSQYRTLHTNATYGFGSCRRLVLSEFRNVKISYGEPNNTVNVKMDLHFKHEMSTQPEIFIVAIRMTRSKKGQFELISYERITPYSIYSVCADKGVDVKLCICNSKTKSKVIPLDNHPGDGFREALSLYTRIEYIDSVQKCLYFVVTQSDNNHGVLIEVVNRCANSKYRLRVGFWKINMITSNLQANTETVLLSGDVTLILAAVQRTRNHRSDWKYSAKIELVS